MLVVRGDCEKAVQVLESIGYTDALRQVEMIQGFIHFQEQAKRGKKRHGRLRRTR
jgi:hypothetical protein